MPPNQQAFLNTIATSEGTIQIPNSDNGYKVLVGATPEHPLVFQSYDSHPNIFNEEFKSTAAGKYQANKPSLLWYCAANPTALKDFTPATQDAIALWLIDRHGATQDVIEGNFAVAITKCTTAWASLPGNDYKQLENTYADLLAAYTDFGGTVSA